MHDALSGVDAMKAEHRPPGVAEEVDVDAWIAATFKALGCPAPAREVIRHGSEHAVRALSLGQPTVESLQSLWLDGVACGLSLTRQRRAA